MAAEQDNIAAKSAAKANASTPRYLTATTASSRNRAAVASTSSDKKPDKLRTPGSASTSTRTPVSGTSTSGKSVKSSRSSKAPSSGPVASTSKRPTPAAVTKPRPLQKSTSSSPPTQSISKASTSTAPPIPSKPPVDSLQAAAQSLPWAFMTTNLENGFKSAELAARKELNDHEQKLTAQEAEVSDQRVRFQAEKAIAFYEELATDELSKTLPAVMEMYMDHGATCERITADALRLANGYQGSSIRPYNDTLVEIRHARSVSSSLESSFASLLVSVGRKPESTALDILRSCSAILRTRAADLTAAEALVQATKENLGMKLHLESLQLSQ